MNPAETIEGTTLSGVLPRSVEGKRVVLCLGSGGVGKTTTSAALAIALAHQGERVVVLTIDPARRLADALGLSGSLGNKPIRIELPPAAVASRQADSAGPTATEGQLWAAMLDPAETFEHIIRSEAADNAHAERILNNRLFANLTTSLSGTNEYMATERLHQLHGDERFDRVIVDTPPSLHVMDFLDSPGRLTRFVDHRLYRSVFAPRSRLLRPLNTGTQIIMRMLARLVGSNLVDDVVSFFADFEGLDQGFRRRADEIDRLLTGPSTAYVLVTAPRQDRLAEADWILDNLNHRGRSLNSVVANRVLPLDPDEARSAIAKLSSLKDLKVAPLIQNLQELGALAQQESELINRLERDIAARFPAVAGDDRRGRVPMIRLAEQRQPVSDMAGLADLAELLAAD